MKRFILPVVFAVSLALGAFAGFRYANHRYARAVTDTIASYEFLNAADRFTALRDLRLGNTNAVIATLEAQLDTSVLALRGILDDYPTVGHANNYTNLLRRIPGYRSTYPHHSDITNMDASVAEILNQVNHDRK